MTHPTHAQATPDPRWARGDRGHAPRRPGFTLIELIVVILIIAVLVSILLPALGGARKEARRIECLTNLKSLGVGLQLYYEDNDTTLPFVLQTDDGFEADESLVDLMADYIDAPTPRFNEQTGLFENVHAPYRCPEDLVGNDEQTNFEPVWRTNGSSYWYNAGEFMFFVETFMPDRRDPARFVTRVYEQRSYDIGPVVSDADNWHRENAQGNAGKNALYFGDWRADWYEQEVDPAG